MSEPTRYVLWIAIEEQVPQDDEDDDCNDCGLPEPIEVEFATLEAAEHFRDYLIAHADAMSTYVVNTYAPVYEENERLQKQLNPFIYNLEGNDDSEATAGDSGPTLSEGDAPAPGGAEEPGTAGVAAPEDGETGAVANRASADDTSAEHAEGAAYSLRSRPSYGPSRD